MASPRTVRRSEIGRPKPIYTVWELTMRCDHACSHCGSRAAKPRPDELDRDKLLETADAIVRLGTREVTLIGGEAYLHPLMLTITRRLSKAGVRVTMQTGGRNLVPGLCRRLREAGLAAIGVSVDGPADVHDVLRNAPGSHAAAIQALRNAREAGFITSANTQINNLTADRLRQTCAELRAAGIAVWRLQLTVPMGRAADRPDWILDPPKIVDVIDTLAELQIEAAEEGHARGLPPRRFFNIMISNNVGYFGPHEHILRSRPGGVQTHWHGCQAGMYTIGIESDGVIKGCPSLPTAPYVGGNVRDVSLEEIWQNAPELQFVRTRTVEELWGFCRTCYYADLCRGGCSFTTHCTLGRRGNNPFCYHRASTLAKQGIRERLVQVEGAAGLPYDFGRFELVEEALPPADG